MCDIRLVVRFTLLVSGSPHIDLLVVEALMEVVVDSVVGDGTEERHVRYTSRLLLLEPFTPVGLNISAAQLLP